MPSPPLILVLNSGSSSLKYAVFSGAERIAHATLDRLGKDRSAALRTAIEAVATLRPGEPLAGIGHRVVHGGMQFSEPVRVTPEILDSLEKLTPLAPLHEPYNVEGIRAAMQEFPGIPQVACFDTAFHATMPRVEQLFGLPRRYADRGIRRYGFHGLAYQSVIEQLYHIAPEVAGGRVIACHLGSGASLCAMRGGRSLATTMSFTPLDGLMMSTRPGHLDPGVVLYLERHEGLTADQVNQVLTYESGFYGVSGGISADLRDLLHSSEPAAAEAIELYCYRIVREIGAMTACIEGVDAIVFSGGIGENAITIRERICQQLGWLNVLLDTTKNRANAIELHDPASQVNIYRVKADEEQIIARATMTML